MGEHIVLTASDGFKLGAYRADPAGPPRGGNVVIQEIMGVNHHIRAMTDLYAAQGYLAVAPALFDRAEPGYDAGYDGPSVQRVGREAVNRFRRQRGHFAGAQQFRRAFHGSGKQLRRVSGKDFRFHSGTLNVKAFKS